MKVLTCGTGGTYDDVEILHKLVARVLDKLHDDFVVDEVVRGADDNIGSVDHAVDDWCRDNSVAQRIFEVVWKNNHESSPQWGDSVFRRNVRMLAANPDLIVRFDGVEGASPFLNLRLVRTPILLVEVDGGVRTFGVGWGEFVRARLGEGARGQSGPRINEIAQSKGIVE